MSVGSIQEKKRALHPFAGFDEGEILCAHQISHGARDRKKQRIGRAPPSALMPFEPRNRLAVTAITGQDLTKLLIAGQNAIERPKVFQCARSKGLALMTLHKSTEPFAQCARLTGDRIQLPGHGVRQEGRSDIIGYEVRLSQPVQQFDAAAEPFYGDIHGSRYGVEKVEAESVGNE